jgi:hypothetical protein
LLLWLLCYSQSPRPVPRPGIRPDCRHLRLSPTEEMPMAQGRIFQRMGLHLNTPKRAHHFGPARDIRFSVIDAQTGAVTF